MQIQRQEAIHMYKYRLNKTPPENYLTWISLITWLITMPRWTIIYIRVGAPSWLYFRKFFIWWWLLIRCIAVVMLPVSWRTLPAWWLIIIPPTIAWLILVRITTVISLILHLKGFDIELKNCPRVMLQNYQEGKITDGSKNSLIIGQNFTTFASFN